jgi:serine/threonine protein kinase
MIGQILKHYRILEQIGAGGMGVVYRAHDEELDRDVAIKVLPAGTFADDSASRRFRKEALSLARLNHPNVATIHEFSSDNGIDFLVTEYIPGLSLDSKIAGRPLPAQKIMNLGIQLAHGLAGVLFSRAISSTTVMSAVSDQRDARVCKVLDIRIVD